MPPVFSFTVDIDWAPPEILAETLDLFQRHGVRTTLFLTDPAPKLDLSAHELAIHPHFTDREPPEATLGRLLAQVPGARGLRSHALAYNYRWLADYVRCGLAYDSSMMIYDQPGLASFRLVPDLWEIPVFWMDYVHLTMHPADAASFRPECLNLDTPGLKVFDVHPHHMFLNTEDLARYERAKSAYHDPSGLREHRLAPSAGLGVRVLVERVLDWAREHDCRIATMSELLAEARQSGSSAYVR